MTVLERPLVVAARRPTTRAPLWAAGIGTAGAAVTAWGVGTPSYWGDEAASVMSASRPLWSLWAELGHIDAVHGLYYFFLHFWVQVFGTSEAATRAPSVIAAGLAIAGTVVLGNELLGLRRGVIAGIVVAAIPELTRMAIETRSYAFGIAVAVWLTWMLVRLVRRRESRPWVWAAYSVATALSIYLFLYLALMLVVAATVMVVERPPREIIRLWLRALIGTAILVAPFVAIAYSQQQQIAFLAHRNYATANEILVHQWFARPMLAVLGWSMIVVGALASVLRRHRIRRSERGALVVIAVWLLVPTVVLVAANAIHPMYNMRYLAFCVPAVAMAMAVGIDRIAGLARRHRARVLVTAVLVGAVLAGSFPTYLAQRTPYAKDGGSDLRLIAATIAENAAVGDAVLFDTTVHPRQKPRLALDLYPAAFAGLTDVQLVTPYVNRGTLWDRVAPVETLAPTLLAQTTVWAVEGNHSTSIDLGVLTRLGFEVVDTIPLHRTTVYELQRTP